MTTVVEAVSEAGAQVARLRTVRVARPIAPGRWATWIRRAVTLLRMGLAIPFVFLVRAVRPAILIRFGQLPSSKLGPLAANTEVYLGERQLGLRGLPGLDLFYHTQQVCNGQLQRMWDRVLHTHPFVGDLDRVNQWLPGGTLHVVPWRRGRGGGDRDLHGVLERTTPSLSLTPEENRQGRAFLQHLGIPDEGPWVCFLARDFAYLETTHPTERDWRYHDYRNSTITHYLLAVEQLVHQGYWAFRMGVVVKEPLPPTHPRIIDYATRHRSEFLDIFLGARCWFFLGDTSGFLCVPMIFRRPLALVNYIPLEYVPSWGPNDLFIPKKLWLRQERRLMTFREILQSGVGRYLKTDEYANHGIEIIENTPEEIAALAMEMEQRLTGAWQPTVHDRELQQRFWALFESSELHGVTRASIGAQFLREHQALLE
jgi:putative glycosyltransferase (TIGR04372 family)